MSVLYLLIGVSFLVAILFLVFFVIAIKSGQFDDTYTPAIRVLFDDESQYSLDKKEQKSIHKI